MTKQINIMITSAGGLIGTFLAKHLTKNMMEGYRYRLVAVDFSEHVYVKHLADRFYKVPMTGGQGYAEQIFALLKKEDIHILFPTSAMDVSFFSGIKKDIQAAGVSLLICDPDALHTLHHKKKMMAFMNRLQIPVPEIYEKKEDIRYPAMIKKCESSGSRGVWKLENEQDYEYWSAKLGDHVVTTFIEGNEYTVDCLFDQEGKLVAYNQRQRLETMGGGATVCRNVNPREIASLIHKFSANIKLEGPANFQYFISKHDNNMYITDFNPRFASGGLPLTVASGYDFPNMIIRILLGLANNAGTSHTLANPPSAKNLAMYRYFEEYFCEENPIGNDLH